MECTNNLSGASILAFSRLGIGCIPVLSVGVLVLVCPCHLDPVDV